MKKKSVSERLGEWVGEYHWTHYFSGSFYQPCTWGTAEQRFRRFVESLERKTGPGWAWFVALEAGGLNGRQHVHALLSFPQEVPSRVLQRAWSAGKSHVRLYDPKRRAAVYVAKDQGTDRGEYAISETPWYPKN